MKKRLTDIYFVDPRIILFPFTKTIKRYNVKSFKDDIIAGLSVALLTIPQAIAYSLLANLPVQAGIFSAIFGSIFSGIFGASKHLIAGPSTGISILIQMIISNIMHTHFPNLVGDQREIVILNLLTTLVFIIGVFQLLFAFLKLGKLLQFVSRSVILGYFAGVAFAIIVNQLFYFFGISSTEYSSSIMIKAYLFITNLHLTSWLTLLIGILSLGLLILLKFKYNKFPNALTMIIFISLFVYFINLVLQNKIKVPTLEDLGMLNVPNIKLIIPFLDFKFLDILFFPAIAVALLSILEVSSISKGIATQSGQKTRSNQEIFGVGIANFLLSFFYSAMPASASVSRTALNFSTGAKTKFAAIYSGLITTILIFFFWPLVKHIPLCSLAAILIVMVLSVLEFKSVKLCFKATLGDAIVFSLTMASCIIFRLDIAFFIGIVISIVFFLQRASEPNLVEYVYNKENKLVVVSPKLFPHRNIRIIGIAGELFFAAVDLFQNTLQKIIKDPEVKIVILRLKNIYHVDASMCLAILRLDNYLKSTNRYLLICGITEEVWQIFHKTGVISQLGKNNVFLTSEERPQLSTRKAFEKAKKLISK